MNIDPGSLAVYGVPWMLAGLAFIFVVKYVVGLLKRELLVEFERLFQAGWAVGGYFLINNLESIETLWPSMPVLLPQVLIAVGLFAGMLGFKPGEMVEKIKSLILIS